MDVEVQAKDALKKLDKAKHKLKDYEKREVSMLNLRRSVNAAELRADQLQKELKSLRSELKSLRSERDRAVERFGIRRIN